MTLADPAMRLAAENERRLMGLLEAVHQRVMRLGPLGGEVLLRVRVEKGGRIGRDSRLTVEEFLQTEREGA